MLWSRQTFFVIPKLFIDQEQIVTYKWKTAELYKIIISLLSETPFIQRGKIYLHCIFVYSVSSMFICCVAEGSLEESSSLDWKETFIFLQWVFTYALLLSGKWLGGIWPPAQQLFILYNTCCGCVLILLFPIGGIKN